MIPIISSNLSALRAFGKKMAVIANNVANIKSEGFKKSRAVLKGGPVNEVSVDITRIKTPGPLIPVEEDDKTDFKETSNVELSQEIPEASLTKRYYQANLAVVDEEDEMLGTEPCLIASSKRFSEIFSFWLQTGKFFPVRLPENPWSFPQHTCCLVF